MTKRYPSVTVHPNVTCVGPAMMQNIGHRSDFKSTFGVERPLYQETGDTTHKL